MGAVAAPPLLMPFLFSVQFLPRAASNEAQTNMFWGCLRTILSLSFLMMERTNEGLLGQSEKRPARSQLYPWYDSVWLTQYDKAKAIVRQVKPEALEAFVEACHILRTRPDFEVKLLEKPLDEATLDEIRQVVKSLRPTDLELHEAR